MAQFRKTWIFDLDNTLHDAGAHIFPHLNRSMTDYVQAHLGVDRAEANRVRVEYWQRYGATLVGMMRHHDVDPRHFLQQTHDFPDLEKMIVARRELRWTLKRLPGRKIVFSNAPAHYLTAVLDILGIKDLFDDAFSIERTQFRPKPDMKGFLKLMNDHRLHPKRCVMVEDSLDNLRTAKRLGMGTVWIDPTARSPAWVDVSIRHLRSLPRCLARLA